jgi:hypothetical protein
MKNLNEDIGRLRTLMSLNEYSKVVDTYPNIKFLDRVVGNSTPSQDRINPALLQDVQKAAEMAGVIVGVTTAVSGHISLPSRHPDGNAVDIAIIDNKAVNTSNRRGADEFVKQLVNGLGYTKNKEVGNPKSVLTFGFPKHDDHVHVSNTSGSPTSEKDIKSVQSTEPSSFANSLMSKLSSFETSNTSDPLLMNILKSVGGIAGLVSMTEIKEIDDVYNSINETKKELNKLILKESKVFGSLGNDITYSYGDAHIPKNKNTSIKSPVDGTIESISYNSNCSTDVIKITHEINNKPHYLTFCGVDPIKVSAGESVSKGTKLGELKDDVKVTLEDSMGNKLPIKSYLNMKNTETNTNKEKEKEVGTVEKRYSDPLLASIVTAPSRLLKGKKDKEGRYEKRWASPTDPSQPSNWISKWSPSKKNPK